MRGIGGSVERDEGGACAGLEPGPGPADAHCMNPGSSTVSPSTVRHDIRAVPPHPLRLALLALALLAAAIVPFVLFGARLEAWTTHALAAGRAAGGMGAVLCALLLASDVLLPVPSSLVSIACGTAFGFWPGVLVSTLGMTLGSCLGYALGRGAGASGLARWASAADRGRVERLHARFGPWIVALLRPVPVLAEASTVVAGFGRWPWVPFLVLSAAANLVISLFYCGAVALVRGFWAG